MVRRQTLSGTFGSVPVAFNLGIALRHESDWKPSTASRCVCAGETATPLHCERADSGCGFYTSSGSGPAVADAYFDFLYRHSDSSLSVMPQLGGATVADVAFDEIAFRITLGGGDIKKKGFGVSGSLIIGYEYPRIVRNSGFYSSIDAVGALAGALEIQIRYDFASWLYLYASLSSGLAESVAFKVRAASQQDSITDYKKGSGGDIPTYTGYGFGVGSRIPFAHW